MHILITSPIPSHPQNHGNRTRVYSLCRALQRHGATIHYVFGGLEELPRHQELAMREVWDHVHILPPYRNHRNHMSGANYHNIDDWYVEEVTTITQRILSIWRIDYCVANYVWFSKWLEQVPAGIPKYIDTHDVFAERHQRLERDGLDPSWFSTSLKEESKGFDRANTVIAIQSEEAREFAGRTKAHVTTLGHFVETDFLEPKMAAANAQIKVGYLASNNPINQQSLVMFEKSLTKHPQVADHFEFVLAGDICSSPAAAETRFQKAGFVDNIQEFYRDLDLVINPNIGGTGLKIKSIEAMAYGKPLVATADAMVGINTDHPAHTLKTTDAMCEYLEKCVSRDALPDLSNASRQIISNYIAEQKQALDALFPGLVKGKPAIAQDANK